MPLTRAALKALFETGDVPSQANYADLIDTFFDIVQEANDAAAAAAADAADALAIVEARAARCFGLLKAVDVGLGNDYAVDNVVGATIVLSGTDKRTVTVTFDEDLGDTKYTVLTSNENVGAPTVTSKTSGVIVFTLPLDPGDTARFNFAIFR